MPKGAPSRVRRFRPGRKGSKVAGSKAGAPGHGVRATDARHSEGTPLRLVMEPALSEVEGSAAKNLRLAPSPSDTGSHWAQRTSLHGVMEPALSEVEGSGGARRFDVCARSARRVPQSKNPSVSDHSERSERASAWSLPSPHFPPAHWHVMDT